jgi:hypothetical protein
MRRLLILISLVLVTGCATPRSHGILGINYSEQPARVVMRWECNGESFTTQGTGVCEQKAPSQAKVSVKIPPLEGRVVYSNGQLKATEDFNWYPKQGFFLWKKKPIKDTWADLELGEIASSFGDWPVALDVIGVHPDVGTIVTRGLLYHRICNDVDIPCSKLEVTYECAGYVKGTRAGVIGKCERMSGSAQGFHVQLKGLNYQARPGAKVYFSAPRLGIQTSYTPNEQDFAASEVILELPQVLNGPTLVGIRMAWLEDGKTKQVETRILVVGFAPEWTGLDEPHWRDAGATLEFVKPVLSDVLEANLYEGRELRKKVFSRDRITSFPKPRGTELACAFAWQRDSSDQTVLCLNSRLEEVRTP